MTNPKTITASIDEIVEAVMRHSHMIQPDMMVIEPSALRTALEGLVVKKFETNIKCDCGNPLTEKELYFETCLKCDNFQPCDTTPTEKGGEG